MSTHSTNNFTEDIISSSTTEPDGLMSNLLIQYKHEYYYSGINPVEYRGHNKKQKNLTNRSQKCHKLLTEMSKTDHRNVTNSSQKCHKQLTEMSQTAHRNVTNSPQKCHKQLTEMSQTAHRNLHYILAYFFVTVHESFV